MNCRDAQPSSSADSSLGLRLRVVKLLVIGAVLVDVVEHLLPRSNYSSDSIPSTTASIVPGALPSSRLFTKT